MEIKCTYCNKNIYNEFITVHVSKHIYHKVCGIKEIIKKIESEQIKNEK